MSVHIKSNRMMKADNTLLETTNKAVVLTATAFLLNSKNKSMPTTQYKPQTCPSLRLVSETNQSKTHLSHLTQPVFRGTRTEGKKGTNDGLRLVSETNQSKTHLSHLTQPVFRGTRTEGKKGTPNV